MNDKLMSWKEFGEMDSTERKRLPPDKLGQAAANRILTRPDRTLSSDEAVLAEPWIPKWRAEMEKTETGKTA